MNPETTSTVSSISLWEVLQNQLNTSLAIVMRPVVQQQLLTILAILSITLMLPELIRYWQIRQARRAGDQLKQLVWWNKSRVLIFPLAAPIGSILLINLAIWLFTLRDYPSGMLENVRSLFSLWLIFRLVVTLLYYRWSDGVRPYYRWVLSPMFIIIILWRLIGSSVGLNSIITIPILTIGDNAISLGNLFSSAITFYAFVVSGWMVEQVLNRTLPDRLNAEPGMIQSVATLTRYAILAIGTVFALALLGFDATSLAIVAGGLSVGIGIGLQDIVANFVSGLTLLFEQSLRPGDIIELDGAINEVEKVTLRATIVRTLDNVELIIPNAKFTTAQVNTLTRSSRLIGVRVPFFVHYDSDLAFVRQVALETAVKHELTLADPPPKILNRGFGDYAFLFELFVWMEYPKKRGLYRSDLYDLLMDAFSAHGIKVPYPQRDLHVRAKAELPEE